MVASRATTASAERLTTGVAEVTAAVVRTTAWTTGNLATCCASAWPEPPNVSDNRATTADTRPAPKNFFNVFSSYGGRPSVDRGVATSCHWRSRKGSSVLPRDPAFSLGKSPWIHPLFNLLQCT